MLLVVGRRGAFRRGAGQKQAGPAAGTADPTLMAEAIGSPDAEQAGEEPGLLHRPDRAVNLLAQRSVAVRPGHHPAVGGAAAEGQS